VSGGGACRVIGFALPVRETILIVVRAALLGLAVLAAAPPAGAEVIPVPDAVLQMRAPTDEVHMLRALGDGTLLGEQRSHASVQNDRLVLEIATDFTDGEHWEERAEMSLTNGYRALTFKKVCRRDGRVVLEENVDFQKGQITWLRNGQRGERTMAFTPDTYIGPMLGIILAGVPESALGTASVQAIVFRPEPNVYTLRAEAILREDYRFPGGSEPTTKVRLKADLGPMQNVLFASLIPTHFFWFTRAEPPEFLAFEGSLGYGGRELRMVPKPSAAVTAASLRGIP
jgi:hypothetical protein